MSAVAAGFVPGFIDDLPEADYHADPVPGGSLSHSGALRLLNDSPAHYLWERTHRRASSAAFDLGHAAHEAILGTGAGVVVVDADAWTSKAAREARAAAHAQGMSAILTADAVAVEAMAARVREHPIAGPLLSGGTAERSMFWRDTEPADPTRPAWLRGRIDYTSALPDGRPAIVDYKSARCAGAGAFSKAAADFGYHVQAPWYLAGNVACGGDPDAVFVHVVQEKTPPYEVAVYRLDDDALTVGARLMRAAIDLYDMCTATGVWPGYPTGITPLALPAWYLRRTETDLYETEAW